jgi:hypothetical protein
MIIIPIILNYHVEFNKTDENIEVQVLDSKKKEKVLWMNMKKFWF